MKTSDSRPRQPLSVLRVMDGSDSDQPNPNGPFPDPESLESANCGLKPERPGLTKMGTVNDPVPVTALAANFSPMPRITPQPFGSDRVGHDTASRLVAPDTEDRPMSALVEVSSTNDSTHQLLESEPIRTLMT
jgi:hypothetical protein